MCTEFFECVCGRIVDAGGTVDKFIGDCVMRSLLIYGTTQVALAYVGLPQMLGESHGCSGLRHTASGIAFGVP